MEKQEITQRLEHEKDVFSTRQTRDENLTKLLATLRLQLSESCDQSESETLRHEIHELDQTRLRNARKLIESYDKIAEYEDLLYKPKTNA